MYNSGFKNIIKFIFREQERMEAYWEEGIDLFEEVYLGWRFGKSDEANNYLKE